MVGISANNVDARPIKKRASSLNSVSANSDTSTSTENSVQQDTAYIKKSFFKYENYDLNVGSSIEMQDLVYESAYDDFKNEMVCFNLEASSGITIEGGTVINPKPTEFASFECFKNPERIVIDSKAYAINNSFYIFTTEFNKSQNKYDWTDTININLTKTPKPDGTFISITKESYENMIKSCKDIDIDTLKNIKNLLTASTVTSGISTVGGIANTVMGGVSIANDNSKEDKSDTNKKLDIATTIVSGVTTATSGASTATSAVAISKVNTVIDKVNECKKAINNLVKKID